MNVLPTDRVQPAHVRGTGPIIILQAVPSAARCRPTVPRLIACHTQTKRNVIARSAGVECAHASNCPIESIRAGRQSAVRRITARVSRPRRRISDSRAGPSACRCSARRIRVEAVCARASAAGGRGSVRAGLAARDGRDR
jgi:hypothetical protein